uniref:Uncharacterized protein n=1 Tax=Nelumbo nucifera TaxID=4432 RepID=A0A822YRZ2_NELNU|nr:TPA_asm: hypothetical protein HUJ06_006062 [Nelumbo nucifera]
MYFWNFDTQETMDSVLFTLDKRLGTFNLVSIVKRKQDRKENKTKKREQVQIYVVWHIETTSIDDSLLNHYSPSKNLVSILLN